MDDGRPTTDDGSAAPAILSVGDLLLDVVIRYDPVAGEADTGPDGVQLWPGGSAANFAVWAARCGAQVQFVSRVGRDWSGEMLVHSLDSAGVVPHVRVTDGLPTGRVLVMVDNEGVRRMWSYPGTSATISPDDLDPIWFAALDGFHLTGYSLLREGPRPAALRAFDLARSTGKTLCTLDPNPPHLIADFGPDRYCRLLSELQFDVIFPNLEEGRLLSGGDTPEEVAASLLSLSPLVVLTLGEEGCLVAHRDSAPQTVRFPASRVKEVRDTTGAGDAFAAAFVVEYLAGRNWHHAAKAANQCAADVVARVGAR
jgi:sugar/nucleoside kinase (ribokinase family)